MPIYVGLSAQPGSRQPPSIARLLVDPFKHSNVPATPPASLTIRQLKTPQVIPEKQESAALSAPHNISFAFHRRSVPAKNHFRCVNLLKLESMEATLLHLQTELFEERKSRVYIANVHAEIQSAAVQQKETIEKLEDRHLPPTRLPKRQQFLCRHHAQFQNFAQLGSYLQQRL
ncbi:hypothetical protein BJ741DRAFT_157129 [Chytriomyces cf. hyalinus JEL632]|nr:hypothetical protein BJ741DRAFT_157129 [Chytriomyces cf. hyalinus JEL632]